MPDMRCWTLVVAAVLLGVSGCGGNGGPERVEVAGSVQLNGKPLTAGTITFIPQNQGTAASGEIADGQFLLPETTGPSPGKCRVEILSYQKTGRKIEGPSMDGDGCVAEMKQIIPARYNTRSELECVLNAQGNHACDFTLVAE